MVQGISCCPLLLLLLLVVLMLLLSGGVLGVSAQYIDGGYTQNCGMASTQLRVRNGGFGWDFESEFRRSMLAFGTTGRACSRGMVCAQVLTSVEGTEATYSEDCWDLNGITEYTEVACYTDLCNYNLTFGSYPRLGRSYFRPGTTIRCYNHGQLQSMDSYREVIGSTDYRNRFYHPMPVSHWSSGMCGAAIYASTSRTRIIHERVLTGDAKQKFAMLRICPRGGCDRNVVRDVMSRGFTN